MTEHTGTLGLIVDCVPVQHNPAQHLKCLALDGTLCQVGFLRPTSVDTLAPTRRPQIVEFGWKRRRPRTHEMLDFCPQHSNVADVEVMRISRVDDALDRLEPGDVRCRFTLDLSDLQPGGEFPA